METEELNIKEKAVIRKLRITATIGNFPIVQQQSDFDRFAKKIEAKK